MQRQSKRRVSRSHQFMVRLCPLPSSSPHLHPFLKLCPSHAHIILKHYVFELLPSVLMGCICSACAHATIAQSSFFACERHAAIMHALTRWCNIAPHCLNRASAPFLLFFGKLWIFNFPFLLYYSTVGLLNSRSLVQSLATHALMELPRLRKQPQRQQQAK